MDRREADRQNYVTEELCTQTGYQPDQQISEEVLKQALDNKKNGDFDQNLFEMIKDQTGKLYEEHLTIQRFAEVYCQAESNLVRRSAKIDEEVKNHTRKQEEFTR